ncbi:Alpha/Beta hydrolase protein [Obelidium mucronatum]|nr:Alpha/Beta hydrolase protein [Obelidium mucronatum]
MAPPDAAGLIRAEWVSFPADAADAADAERVILFVHGGAYCLCSRKTHRWASWKLAKDARCRVLVFDYRLAPEHVFPLALHDCISAYSFLINPPPYSGLKKYDPKNVVVMGDSAGGGLALAMMLWIRDHGSGSLAAQQQNQSSDAFDASYLKMPAGVGLLSPWLDLTQSMPSFRINGKYDYLPDKTKDKILNENRSHYYVKDNSFLKNPLVSPYWATESETQPLPPILVQIGEYERLRDENLAFATKRFTTTPLQLEMYDAMIHVFQIFNMVYPLSDLAMQRLAAFAIRVTDPAFRVEDYERKMTRFGSGEGFPTSEITMDLVETYLSAKREDEIEKVEEKEEQELTETVKQMNAKMSELILNGALTVDPEDESSDDLEEDVV